MIFFGATPVRADRLRDKIDLNWLAPEPCPAKAEFLAAIARMLGDQVTMEHTLFANVVIAQPSGTSYQLTLTTRLDGISGQRVLEGRACKVVADAAAVTIALLLNPDLRVPTAPEPSDKPSNPPLDPAQKTASIDEPAPVALPDAAPKEAPSQEPVPAISPHRRWYGILSTQIGLQLGVLPHASPLFSIGVGAGRERAVIGAMGSYSPPQDAMLAPSLGGRLWTASVGVRGCWFWTTRSPRLSNCLGAELTRLHGLGTGVTKVREGVTYWFSPTLSADADFALLGRLWLRLSAAAMVPLTRPDTHLDDIGTVQQPAKVAGRADAGLVVSF